MTFVLAVFLAVHGLIHLLGFAKAFGLAELPQLTQPVSASTECSGCLLRVSSSPPPPRSSVAALVVGDRRRAIALSMVLVVTSWSDAKAGALANLVALVGVLFGFLAQGPFSLQAEYERDIDRGIARLSPIQPVTDAELAHLPAPVQRYLRASGVVGQPRVRNFRVRMHGRIRSGPDARWMPLTAEQHNFVDEPARLFYMRASMFMIPMQGYHRYVGPSATMRVKAAALVPVAVASGEEMSRAETVTLFNDMCVMAPATLIDPAIAWEPVDERTVRASFTNAGHTVRAELSFNDAGELTNFVSDDRYQTSPDGRNAKRVRWSTPLDGYRSFGPVRVAARGEARWHEPGGDYAYIELTLDDVKYNLRSR